jgi:hypothetical protein
MRYDPEHGSDHLSDYDLYRMAVDHGEIPDIPEGYEPQGVHALEDPDSPSCGPGNHVWTKVPVCFVCGAVAHPEAEDA